MAKRSDTDGDDEGNDDTHTDTNADDDGGDDVLRIDELTWEDVETAIAATTTVLVPIGSTEQHGYHLPLGVDTRMPEAICEAVAKRTGCLLAPAIPYGVSPHHTFKPGTISIESETFRRYVRDVCTSMGAWGIEHVLLVNGHYLAQDPELDIVVRDLREQGLEAFHVPLNAVFAEAAREQRTSTVSFHAAEFETSLMLAIDPDLVHMDRAVAIDPPTESLPLTDYDAYGENRVGWALSAADMAGLTEAGNVGDPTVATRETGRVLLDEAIENVARLVEALEPSDR